MNHYKEFIYNRIGLKLCVSRLEQTNSQKLVFIQHGLGKSKDNGNVIAISEAFEKSGYNVVTFDSSNSNGESDKSAEGVSLTSHIQDLEDVIAYARTQSWFVSPFAVAGHSIGATSALFYAEKKPQDVDMLVVLAGTSLSNNSLEESRSARDLAAYEKWKEVGYYMEKDLKIPYSFIEDARKYNSFIELDKVNAQTAVIVGDKEDEIRFNENIKLFEELKTSKKLIVLPETAHNVAESQITRSYFVNSLYDFIQS